MLGNLEAALSEEPRPGADRKLSGKEEALLVATACSDPPKGRARWTLELLAGELVRLTEHDDISRETVRRRLAENELKPWRKDMWCIPQVDGEFVARMEDVLDLYAEAPDPKRPVVCFDESPTQLIGEVREPMAAKPGQLERYDCEYKRNGTANLFIFLDVHRPWRKVKVTDSRAAVDFAARMRDLTDVYFPRAERIRVVLDNLSTHSVGALYQAFPPSEARRLSRRLEFHFVPKHTSWLNMVEIEIAVLRSQCLDRRIDSHRRLVSEIAAWEDSVIFLVPAPNGCSQPRKPAPKWPEPTLNSQPKSHNHCDEVLAAFGLINPWQQIEARSHCLHGQCARPTPDVPPAECFRGSANDPYEGAIPRAGLRPVAASEQRRIDLPCYDACPISVTGRLTVTFWPSRNSVSLIV